MTYYSYIYLHHLRKAQRLIAIFLNQHFISIFCRETATLYIGVIHIFYLFYQTFIFYHSVRDKHCPMGLLSSSRPLGRGNTKNRGKS